MKRALGPVIVVVGVLVVGIATYQKLEARSTDAEATASAGRIRADYLERVGWIRANPDEKAYKEEVGTFLRKYFQDVNEHVNRFQLSKDFDAYLVELDERMAKKRDSDKDLPEKRAAFAQTKKMFDLMKSGGYSPLWSAADKGLRLDILSGEVVTEGGKPTIQLPFVLWGAQRELKDDGRGHKRMFTSANFDVTWKLLDEQGKHVGDLKIEGANGLIDNPERYIDLFPPQMVLGTFPMELLPAEAAKLEWTFIVRSRAPSGGEAVANFQWKMDTPAEWKLKAGEKWEGAQEDFRPEADIDPAKKQAAH